VVVALVVRVERTGEVDPEKAQVHRGVARRTSAWSFGGRSVAAGQCSSVAGAVGWCTSYSEG
jgi:hypothetical protein